ncbi:MAG: hypothetical protein WC205_04595 [Opitutaceae bacterium]|jgi:hypothetical protein
MFTRPEKIELILVAVATGAVAVFRDRLPSSLELGSLLAVAALALLGQGLVRDLWLLRKQRRARAAGGAEEPHEEARCMCMESTVGLSGVLAGVVLTAVGVAWPVMISPWVWPVAAAFVWGAGFAMKDLVIQWGPWKLRRVKDHGSIWVRWR